MAKLVECVPNFSEGRNLALLEELAAAAQSVPGVALLDYSADANHHRSVFTLAGGPAGTAEAVFRMCALAVRRIDLTKHSGGHPRMGAADVIPFVPLRGAGMDECVELSKQLGRRIASELAVPVFLYAESAQAPHRRNLAAVRRGGFEGLAEKMQKEEWRPDYGPAMPHPGAGAVAVGARMPLIAFNINLDTPNLEIAKAIARAVRESSGGYPNCKAIGVFLEDRGLAQVSMNMTDYRKTPLHTVAEAVKREATLRGVRVAGSELVGLAPAAALADCAAHYLQIENFSAEKRVLENRLILLRSSIAGAE